MVVSYIIKEGFKNVFKNKKSTLISMVTMICAMFLFGAFFSIGENVNAVLYQVQKNQGIEVFIENSATDEQINFLEEQIKSLDYINTVVFKSKQEALDLMKENLKDNQELLEGYEGKNNIFPASFIVKIKDQSKYEKVYEKIMKFSNVRKVTKNNESIKQASMINDEINVMFIFWIILIIMCAINILGKIVVILFILKNLLPN